MAYRETVLMNLSFYILCYGGYIILYTHFLISLNYIMGTFSMTFTALGTEISWSGVWLHMLLSTLGNIIGGSILLGLPIYLMIRPKKI